MGSDPFAYLFAAYPADHQEQQIKEGHGRRRVRRRTSESKGGSTEELADDGGGATEGDDVLGGCSRPHPLLSRSLPDVWMSRSVGFALAS